MFLIKFICAILDIFKISIFIMIRHNVEKKNKACFMHLSIFHLNQILKMLIKIDIKQFLFHMWKIIAEVYSILIKTL